MTRLQNTKTVVRIAGFDFNTAEVETMHRLFSGPRSQLSQMVDDRLRCWAMSSSSNPNLPFDYSLDAWVEEGRLMRREQIYSASHVYLSLAAVNPKTIDPENKFLALDDPKQAVRLYDLAFAHARAKAPAETVASYFSLREVIARISVHAVKTYVLENNLNIVYVDDEKQGHFMSIGLHHLGSLSEFLLDLNEAAVPA